MRAGSDGPNRPTSDDVDRRNYKLEEDHEK